MKRPARYTAERQQRSLKWFYDGDYALPNPLVKAPRKPPKIMQIPPKAIGTLRPNLSAKMGLAKQVSPSHPPE